MGKVIVGTTMSLDGYINDRMGRVASLYPNMEELHNTEMLQESINATGAVVMGRHAFDMGQGDFTGYEYQVPIFVITHQPPDQLTKGQNDRLTVTFISNGIENAIRKAKAAAGEKDVTVVGGSSTAQQCLNHRLADELQIGIMPLLLGGGLRFFDNAIFENIQLERVSILETPSRIDVRYRIVK